MKSYMDYYRELQNQRAKKTSERLSWARKCLRNEKSRAYNSLLVCNSYLLLIMAACIFLFFDVHSFCWYARNGMPYYPDDLLRINMQFIFACACTIYVGIHTYKAITTMIYLRKLNREKFSIKEEHALMQYYRGNALIGFLFNKKMKNTLYTYWDILDDAFYEL